MGAGARFDHGPRARDPRPPDARHAPAGRAHGAGAVPAHAHTDGGRGQGRLCGVHRRAGRAPARAAPRAGPAHPGARRSPAAGAPGSAQPRCWPAGAAVPARRRLHHRQRRVARHGVPRAGAAKRRGRAVAGLPAGAGAPLSHRRARRLGRAALAGGRGRGRARAGWHAPRRWRRFGRWHSGGGQRRPCARHGREAGAANA